jgi:phage terminase large subunit-like protein
MNLTAASPSSSAKRDLLRLLTERNRRGRLRKLWTYYPDSGPLRRELYPKHMEFFKNGREHHERLFLAANRVGKTEGAGGFELTLHLTGLYPDWWPGYRFSRPIHAWAAGATSETVRDIVQAKLLGPTDDIGTGLIPGACVGRMRPKAGVADAIDTVMVRHVSGSDSMLKFKSYDQGRRSFEGTERDVIWLDEEPPLDIYSECVIRTAATRPGERGGMILATFTPLQGMSETVLYFLPDGLTP